MREQPAVPRLLRCGDFLLRGWSFAHAQKNPASEEAGYNTAGFVVIFLANNLDDVQRVQNFIARG